MEKEKVTLSVTHDDVFIMWLAVSDWRKKEIADNGFSTNALKAELLSNYLLSVHTATNGNL